MNDVKHLPIPQTPIVDNTGQLSREWLYFFNDVGKVVNEAINANLSQMNKDLLESADNSELSLSALPVMPSLSNHLDTVPMQNNEELQQWLLLINN